MGGTSIVRFGKDWQKLLYEVLYEVAKSVPLLWADSALMLYNPTTGEQKAYKIEYLDDLGNLSIKETKGLGRGAPVAVHVACKYFPEPKEGEWVAMVHLHT